MAADRPRRAELYRLYVTLGRSSTEIAAFYGAHPASVRKWLHRYDIPTRPPRSYKQSARIPTEELLRSMYTEDRQSPAAIAVYFGLDRSDIIELLDRYEINRVHEPEEVIPAPPLTEATNFSFWSNNPHMRDVVGQEEIPFTATMDGKPITITVDLLSCGHTKRSRSGDYVKPEKRMCHKCKREAEANG